MPLMILGFVFVVGLFIYYLISTSGSGKQIDGESEKKKKQAGKGNADTPPAEDDGVTKKDNVIYLSDDIEKIKKNHNIGGE